MNIIKKNKINSLYLSLFIIFILISAFILYIINARMSAYPYNTALDYNYDFSGTSAKRVNLQLKGGKFTLPTIIDPNYSVFLKIDISSTVMGNFFQPKAILTANLELKLKSGLVNRPKKIAISEYFENGAKGIRYINISPLLSLCSDKTTNNSIEIELKGDRVIFKDQPIEVILFENDDIKTSKILIIAPHPDDAEIAAFGLYSSSHHHDYLKSSHIQKRSLDNSKNIYIVTITAGDAGTYQYDEIYSDRQKHFLKKGRLRTWNSITIPMLGGIAPENILNLGFFDGTLAEMFNINPSNVKALYTGVSNIEIFRQQNISPLVNLLEGDANWSSLVKNLENLLIKIEPDIIVIPYPALDRHPDHKFSSIATFEAIKRANIKRGNLYFYTNHFVLNEYYPYGEMGGVVSLPPAFDKSIYFKSIYSHILSTERQREKIFSLEAMNDLRPDTSWRFSEAALKMAFTSIKRDIIGINVSYYRRAVRNNELFFVVPINDIYDKSIEKKIIGELLPNNF